MTPHTQLPPLLGAEKHVFDHTHGNYILIGIILRNSLHMASGRGPGHAGILGEEVWAQDETAAAVETGQQRRLRQHTRVPVASMATM